MNIEAAKRDVQISLRRLPREFILDVAGSFARHKDQILAAVPLIMKELQGHAAAAGLEWSGGILDLAALEQAGKELLAEFIAVDLDTSSTPHADDAANGYVREE